MEPFKSGLAPPGFCFQPEADDGGGAAAGALDIYIHHARNIHNICIYANQDVYAKFSLTSNPDDAVSTRIVAGGGKNPQFNERLQLQLKLGRPAAAAAVLKCEMWMLSRARNFLEDQLLGFALVPLSAVAEAGGGGPLTRDFSLSSTDLFHSPAGTVRLTLSYDDKPYAVSGVGNSSSISSEFVILDPSGIEFPEINVDRENQRMASEYFSAVPFVHLGGSPESMEDCEMTVNSNESPDGSNVQNSALFSNSTITSVSDDRQVVSTVGCSGSKGPSPDTPTSKSGKGSAKCSTKEEEEEEGSHGVGRGGEGELGSVFKYPLGNINMEAEQSAMQQQIVDMYMRSMKQFTESLAKMKLPMDLHNPKPEVDGDVIQSQKGNNALDSNKKDGSRVFYGSRAFF